MILSTTDRRSLESLRNAAYEIAHEETGSVATERDGLLTWGPSWLDFSYRFEHARWHATTADILDGGRWT